MNNSLEDIKRLHSYSACQQKAELQRALAEIQFAENLCYFHPQKKNVWKRLIQKATEPVRHAVIQGGRQLGEAICIAEKILMPLRSTAKTYTIYCVGHGHIDMNWMWSWPETVAVTNDTFSTVLRLMDEFPQFYFSQSQASVYSIVEQHHPEMLRQIARRVKEGRWEVTASHWVEGDKNLASGESLCRHLLYARRYMQQLFNLKPEDVPIDWSPDTFGHAATIPTYLVRGGVKYLYFHRPGVHTVKKPSVFWWQASDGSRVLVNNAMKVGYNGQISPEIARYLVDFVKETGCRDFMFVYGVGNHGGGPTRRDILLLNEMAAWPIFPQVRFSTAKEFYLKLEKQSSKLPVIQGELNTEFTGSCEWGFLPRRGIMQPFGCTLIVEGQHAGG